MNNSEKRRKQLLNETRNLYSDRSNPPAVHPRYRSAYTQLYHDSDSETRVPTGTFGVRTFICFLLFALFVAADYKGAKIANMDMSKIVDQIKYEIDVENVWKRL